MSGSLVKLWGYRADGDARLFHVPAGGKLPAGWSADISVMPHELRDGYLLCERAGETVLNPEIVRNAEIVTKSDDVGAAVESLRREHWKTRAKREREEAREIAERLMDKTPFIETTED